MTHTIVRYTVKPGEAEHNAELVRAVYRELAELRPQGFSYATYLLDDGTTFVHVATQEGEGENPLRRIAAFAAFQDGISDRCESQPVVSRGEQVGGFGG
jgi:hypothetical protein